MLYREISEYLKQWKNREHHPLVIRGLRQIGKTYSVRKFGEEAYDNVVYIDLRANIEIHKAFDGDFNVDMMTLYISANIPSARFIPGHTLLILDEIQDCPNARSSLKYWDLDGRYDVIATGSFLGVKGFRMPYERGIPVGYEEQVEMYPLTFKEFLLNTGMNVDVYNYVKKQLNEKKTVEKSLHEAFRRLYLQYMVVGGMPEAVIRFFNSYDINQVREVQTRILMSITDDFGRTNDKTGKVITNEVLKLRAEACLKSIPAQLAKEYKKFQYSLVNAKGHSTEKADGIQYLEDVGLVVRAFNTRELTYPLEAAKIPNEFKAFYIDTGLLVSQLGEDVAAKILDGDLGAYKGAIAENMVAAALAKNGDSLFYFHDATGSPELDFLYEKDGQVGIIECKATNGAATSMKFVLAHKNRFGTHPAVKLADTNIGAGDGYDTMPLYSLGFLENKHEVTPVETVDVTSLRIPN